MANVTALGPASLWQQISNCFFLMSGVFNDLLVIRTLLTCAYIFLFVTGGLGHPGWPGFTSTGAIAVDTLVWSFLNIMLHGFGVMRMFWDERKISLPEQDDAFWRYIYRHSGLSRAQFHHLLKPKLELKSYHAGDPIPTKDYFYVIRDGVVAGDVAHLATGLQQSIRMYSGEMFPLENMYCDYMPQQNLFMKSWIKPRAATDVKLYAIPTSHLKALSVDPNAKEAWMALLVATLAEIAERPYKRQSLLSGDFKGGANDSNGGGGVVDDDNDGDDIRLRVSNPLFDSLEPSEEPDRLVAGSNYAIRYPIQHLFYYMKASFFVPWPIGTWPIGLRHRMLPPHDPKCQDSLSWLSKQWEEQQQQQKTT
eukprot:CAMPEP_0113448334 /NCGR_PEP_ID=MMETSP0014_2-20120614/4713_1 /TAXON_ID=2857 /ORGANISM="Nitzschia sp." /LENGTH=364 /DNA_ID=CAMNT_0000339543 /DNA_START=84 /DNA_END=1174 /DNA_ORIENTATION=- /assembly_acc=CAM_ASM_000159